MKIAFPIEIELGKAGGVETYARNLVRSLQDIDDSNEYSILCTALNEKAFPVRRDTFKKIIVKGRVKLSVEAFTRQVLALTDRVQRLKQIKKNIRYFIIRNHERVSSPATEGDAGIRKAPEYDMVHHMFSCYPFWKESLGPVVLTIVDIQQEYFPEFFSEEWTSAEKADHIMAISGYTKKTIVEKYGIPDGKITVVYLGYNSEAFKKFDQQTVEEFRNRLKLPKDYLFYPAASWAHKNHLNLIRALKILKDKYRFDGKLLLTGIKKDRHGVVAEEVQRLGLGGEVIYLGYLAYEDLPLLYNAARLLVFPSLFEGFGMPVVEAFAVGLPVVCSDTTSLPEVCGEAAHYFDPTSPDDIAEKVFKALSDNTLRERLVKKGFERAKVFTWENSAMETLKVYENVFRKN